MRMAARTLLPLLVLPLLILAFLAQDNFLQGRNDFLQFYCAAKLLASNQLYDAPATWALHTELTGKEPVKSVLFARPPFYALAFLPLAALPYRTAYWLFQAASFAALLAFVWMFRKRAPDLPFWCALSMPLLVLLLNGQDVAFVLLLIAVALNRIDAGRDFEAGLVLSLCAIKFHLLWVVPLGLLVHRRWRILSGGLTGVSMLLSISFIVAGFNWPAEYLARIRGPEIHPLPHIMGNLRSLALLAVGDRPWFDAGLHVIAIGAFLLLARREGRLPVMLGYALIAGLLTARHTYVQDFALLLVAVPLIASSWPITPRRIVEAVLLLPPIYYAVMHPPLNVILPGALLLILIHAAFRTEDAKECLGPKDAGVEIVAVELPDPIENRHI
jgi:hypothetical protein